MLGSKIEIDAKIYWLFVKNQEAHPLGLAPIESYQGHLSPLIESNFEAPHKIWMLIIQGEIDSTYSSYLPKITQIILEHYQTLLKTEAYLPGKYGDWIKCSVWSNSNGITISIDLIGKAAWNKATLASDLGIFVKGSNSIYFVGIVRKNPPGQGLPAIIGGIRNTNTEFDSSLFTAIKEAKEEANLDIEVINGLESIKEDYTIQVLPVQVKGFEKFVKNEKILTEIMYVITVKTPESERLLDGTKRVYATDAFVIFLDLGNNLVTEKLLREVFHAGDDATELAIFDISKFFNNIEPIETPKPPQFGLEHHGELFLAMVEKIKHTRKI